MVTCPSNAAKWILTSNSFGCGRGEEYHCVKTQIGSFIEVCKPYIWVQPEYCPEWNIAGKLDVTPCSGLPGCPTDTYQSNEVYKYPVCIQTITSTSTRTTTAISTTTTTIPNTTLSSAPTESSSLPNSDVPQMTWFSVLFYFLSCVVLVALIFFMARYYIMRKRRAQKEKDYKDPEQQPVNGKENAEPTEDPTSTTPFLPEPEIEEEIEEKVDVNEETGFIRSEAYKEGLEAINKDHVVLIIGSPGSGKTATGNEILSTYRKQNWKCTPLDGLHKADSNELNLNFNIKQVIFVDNCFGYWTSDLPETRLLKVKGTLKHLFTNGFKRPGDTKLILAIGKTAYSKHVGYLRQIPGLLKSRTIDLDSKESFSVAQKDHMVSNLLTNLESANDDRKVETLRETLSGLSSNDGIGFPLKIQLLCQMPKLPVQDFLQNTLGCLIKYFKEMQNSESESGKLDYAALVYVMLKGRFSDKCRLDKSCSERLYGSYGEQSLKRQLQGLDGKYLKKDQENFYVFAHGILYISVFHALYHDDPECLLEHCNIDAILELVRSGTQGSINDPFVVNLKMADFPVLVERIENMKLELYFVDHQLQDTKIFKEMFDLRLKIRQLDNKFSEKERIKLEKIKKGTMAVDNKDKELKKAIKKSRTIADESEREGIEWVTHRSKYKELVDYVRR